MAKKGPNGFWVRVNRAGPIMPHMMTPCWVWTGDTTERGYGRYRVARKLVGAHRLAWEDWNGPIPAGRWVLHRCDNRACVNPDHLFLGDNAANIADMIAKGRGRKAHGETHPKAKLTADAVRTIRRERAALPPTPLKTLADRYGVSLVAVSRVALGKSWHHVL